MVLIRTISLSILVAFATTVSAQDAPANATPPASPFVAIDLNKDGFVTFQEVGHWAQSADVDRDGKLSRTEFAMGHVSAKQAQANLMKQRELMRAQRIAAKFASADRNGDGAWDRSEIAEESRRHFHAVDTAVNNDKTKKFRHEIKSKGATVTEADYLSHHTAVIAVADTDKNGRITAAEYMKWTKDASK